MRNGLAEPVLEARWAEAGIISRDEALIVNLYAVVERTDVRNHLAWVAFCAQETPDQFIHSDRFGTGYLDRIGLYELLTVTDEVLTALRRTFITPLDRGDIKDLITSMDDAIDQMNQTAKVITLFELRSFDPPMREMGEIIVRSARLSMDAVPLLGSLSRESSRLHGLTEEMIRLEEQADQLHDQGRKELFQRQKDPIGFVIGSEVYNHLEMVVDRFEDVANEISAIVIENV